VTLLRSAAQQRDLLLVGLYLVVAAATVFLPIPVVRAVATIPLVLFVPGYAIVATLFPALVVPTVERILMSIAVSIGTTIAAGLLLAFAGIALTPASWLLALTSTTTIFLVLAATRRYSERVAGPRIGVASMPRLGAFAVLVAVLIAGNVVLGSRIVAGEQQANPPLSLWMIPAGGRPLAAELGVHAGDVGGRYSVVISSAGNVVDEYHPVLEPQQTWKTVVTFDPEVRATPIVARLYEPGAQNESRYVVLQPANRGG
jgi:hypothetical protein